MARWLSLHCFLSDTGNAERFLLERVVPLATGWQAEGSVTRWFFIRYWEGGPHLRLRFQGELDGDRASAALTSAIGEFVSAVPPQRDDYYAAHPLDGAAVDRATLPWFEEGSVVQIPYVTEDVRYGGSAAMPTNETLFAASSTITAALIRATPDDMPRRIAAAMPMMAAAATAAGLDAAGASRFFADYAAFWARYSPANIALAANLAQQPVDAAAAAMLARLLDGVLPSHARSWSAAVTALIGQLANVIELRSPFDGAVAVTPSARHAAVLGILGSHIHMHNNRLGIAPVIELLLATRLARAARSLAGGPAPITIKERAA